MLAMRPPTNLRRGEGGGAAHVPVLVRRGEAPPRSGAGGAERRCIQRRSAPRQLFPGAGSLSYAQAEDEPTDVEGRRPIAIT